MVVLRVKIFSMLTSISNINIRGIMSCVPEKIHTRADLEKHISQEHVEKIADATGITERRFIADGQTLTDLAYPLADRLLKQLNWGTDTVDALIFVTQTPDYLLPNNSSQLQNKLGLPYSTLAFDINQGCAGFVQGLYICASLLGENKARRALLVTGDATSRITAEGDQNTRPLFGDAVAVTALEYTPENIHTMHFEMVSDGAGAPYLMAKGGGLRDGIAKASPELFMDGTQVFAFTLKRVPKSINTLLEYAKVKYTDIDHVVLHQANAMMINHLGKKLNIPKEKLLVSIKNTGNTSSASIPVAITSNACKGGEMIEQSRYVMSGFGVGWTWASCLINFENCFIDRTWILNKSNRKIGHL
jgi:3-oxoacyl-[acyl-carrier-protein] synthase-3